MTVRTLSAAPSTERGRPGARPSLRVRLWKRAKHEVRRLFPAWLYFFLSFSLLRLTQTAVLQEFGVTAMPQSRVLMGSVLVAKALITVDQLKLFRRLNDRPVLVSALFRTYAYMLVVFFFEYSEVLFENRKQGFAAGSAEFAAQVASLRFWVIQIWVLVLLFVFSGARALVQRLGRRRFRQIFVGR